MEIWGTPSPVWKESLWFTLGEERRKLCFKSVLLLVDFTSVVLINSLVGFQEGGVVFKL